MALGLVKAQQLARGDKKWAEAKAWLQRQLLFKPPATVLRKLHALLSQNHHGSRTMCGEVREGAGCLNTQAAGHRKSLETRYLVLG